MNRFIRYKIYLQRSSIYFGIINNALLFGIFAKLLGLPFWIIAVSYPAGLCIMLIAGYIDRRFVLTKENELLYKQTPQITDILNTVNEINSKLDK